MAVLKQIKFGDSISKIQFTEVKSASNGVITATPSHTDSGDENNPEYAIDLTIVNDGTLVKENKALKVGTVPAAQVSVAAGGYTEGSEDGKIFEGDDVEEVLTELKNKIDAVDGAAKSYSIVKQTTGLETNVKEQYRLQETVGETNTLVGDTIKIYKDSSLKSVALNGQSLDFTYILENGSESVVRVDVSTFLTESEFKNGLQVNNGEVSVKIDSASEKDSQATTAAFLTVSADGIKISGIKDEIDRKIAALDVTTDAAVNGQYVAAIEETDGKVAVKTRANVSDAVLNGYTKGSDATAIAATDSLKAALSKLENQVDKAKAAATTKVVEGTDAGNNLEIVPTASDTDGSTTYTINLTDVASKAALDAEIAARKAVDGQEGQAYVANVSTNYISGATSLNDADVKLDAALKAEVERAKSAETSIDAAIGLTKGKDNETRTFVPTTNYGTDSTSVVDNMQKIDTALKTVSDKADAIQYKVNGTTLEFFGISKKQTV